MQLGEKPKTEDELNTLRLVKKGEFPDERELQRRMEEAAKGKVKQNGIMRRPGDKYRP